SLLYLSRSRSFTFEFFLFFFFFNDTATTEIYTTRHTLSLHDALPISMVNTSRRIPPTPVAAPWYGSTAEGWLCDSILKATARPSPIEITPAFSPGPCSTYGAVVGKVFKTGRECL